MKLTAVQKNRLLIVIIIVPFAAFIFYHLIFFILFRIIFNFFSIDVLTTDILQYIIYIRYIFIISISFWSIYFSFKWVKGTEE
jgi:hypothetical protein